MASTIESNDLTSISGLRDLGFQGFRRIANLRGEGMDGVATEPGVYLVVRCSVSPPRFLAVGTGGHFKGQDPNVPISRLTEEWVSGALVLYVGQTGSNSKGTLRTRIRELIRFGEGVPIGHKGGRLVWQLQEAEKLQICWRTLQHDNPRGIEKELIRTFKTFHEGRRPFANLRD